MHRNYFQKKVNSVLLEKINMDKGSVALNCFMTEKINQNMYKSTSYGSCIEMHFISLQNIQPMIFFLRRASL